MKRAGLFALKLVVAGLLIGWLLHAGALDFSALRLFLDRPWVTVTDLGVLATAVVLGALRWRLLLRSVDVRIGVARALQLQLTGLFFNVVVPGGIGGDVVKAIYVARDEAPALRPGVYLIAFVDRIIGVAGLIVIAAIAVAIHGHAAWEPPLRGLSLAVAGLASALIIGPIVVLAMARRLGVSSGRGALGRIIDATRLVASRPGILAVALVMAIAVHLACMSLFGVLASATAAHDVPLRSIASIFPLGMLTTALPISLGGIGIGHVAFERLFSLVSLDGGANTFNLYLIGQSAPCLLGVVTYLTLRQRRTPPSEIEAVP